MIRVLQVVALLMMSLPSLGQHSFGPKINIGLSSMLIRNHDVPQTNKFYLKPSGQFGLFYNYSFKRISIGANLVYMPIYGKKYAQAALYDGNGNIYGYDKANIQTYIHYLSLPVYAGVNFKKFCFNLGVQTNLVLKSGSKFIHISNPASSDKKYHSINIRNWQWGFNAGVNYKLNRKVTLEVNYYFEPFNPYKSDYSKSVTTWRIHQVTIGLSYNLLRVQKS